MEDNSFSRDTHTDHSSDAPQGMKLAMQSHAPASPPQNAAANAATGADAHSLVDVVSGTTATGNVITGVGTLSPANATGGGANARVSGVSTGESETLSNVSGGGATVQGAHGS